MGHPVETVSPTFAQMICSQLMYSHMLLQQVHGCKCFVTNTARKSRISLYPQETSPLGLPACIIMWLFSRARFPNPLLQRGHINGQDPLWINMWSGERFLTKMAFMRLFLQTRRLRINKRFVPLSTLLESSYGSTDCLKL